MSPEEYVKKYSLYKLEGSLNVRDFMYDMEQELRAAAVVDREAHGVSMYYAVTSAIYKIRELWQQIFLMARVEFPEDLWDMFDKRGIANLRAEFPDKAQEHVEDVEADGWTFTFKGDPFNHHTDHRGRPPNYEEFQGFAEEVFRDFGRGHSSIMDDILSSMGISMEEFLNSFQQDRARAHQSHAGFSEDFRRAREQAKAEDFGNKYGGNPWDYTDNGCHYARPSNSHYEVLQISVNETSVEVVKTQYRKLSRKHHPDRGGDAKDFIKLTESYEIVLKYLVKR